jgi:hypothetical protein
MEAAGPAANASRSSTLAPVAPPPPLPAYFTSRGPSAREYSLSWTTPSLRATSV